MLFEIPELLLGEALADPFWVLLQLLSSTSGHQMIQWLTVWSGLGKLGSNLQHIKCSEVQKSCTHNRGRHALPAFMYHHHTDVTCFECARVANLRRLIGICELVLPVKGACLSQAVGERLGHTLMLSYRCVYAMMCSRFFGSCVCCNMFCNCWRKGPCSESILAASWR